MSKLGKYTKEAFLEYHLKNPHVYRMFEKWSLEVAKSRSHYSAKAIFHRMRWDADFETTDLDFKLSDGWLSHYARLFLSRHPELPDFFKTKTRKDTYHE